MEAPSMRKTLLVFLLLAFAGCATPPPPPAPEPIKKQDATAEFKPLVEKILAAWMTLDAKNAAPYYAKDAGLTFYDLAPLKYSGWSEYEAGFQKIAAGMKSMKLALEPDLQATRYGDIAWTSFTVKGEMEPKEGKAMTMDVRISDVFEKRDGQWIIVHEHVSVPIPEPAPPAKK
jgi:ketosteroid isomerase-like protein